MGAKRGLVPPDPLREAGKLSEAEPAPAPAPAAPEPPMGSETDARVGLP